MEGRKAHESGGLSIRVGSAEPVSNEWRFRSSGIVARPPGRGSRLGRLLGAKRLHGVNGSGAASGGQSGEKYGEEEQNCRGTVTQWIEGRHAEEHGTK